jgi:hypothetical protein
VPRLVAWGLQTIVGFRPLWYPPSVRFRAGTVEASVANILQVKMPDGRTIWARVEAGPADVAAKDVIKKLDIDDLKSTFGSVSEAVQEAARGLCPDTISVEFGVELGVKAGKLVSILAEASGKASLKVSMSWSAEPGSTPNSGG